MISYALSELGIEGIEIEDSISIRDWYSKEEIEIANQKYDAILEKVGNSKIDNKIKDDIKFKKNILLELQRTVDFSEINNIIIRRRKLRLKFWFCIKRLVWKNV